MTDGYQPYHTLMKKDGELKVAGCWAHARRKFAEIIKASRKGQVLTPAQEAASEAIRLIDMIYIGTIALKNHLQKRD